VRTDIEFLNELRDDLMDAAARTQAARRPVPGVRILRPARRPLSTWKVVAAVAALLVVIAGIVGYLAAGGPGLPTAGTQAASKQLSVAPGSAPRAVAGPASDYAFGPHLRYGLGAGGQPAVHGPDRNPNKQATVPGSGSLPAGVPGIGPSIIKTADLYLRVAKDSFQRQFEQATTIAERYGGYVQTSSTSGTKRHSGDMVIRVPADKFALALADLRSLGTVLSQQVSGQDVTSRFVDLGARLQNALTQAASLRRLLNEAPNVSATLRVNAVLTDVQLRIEELRGELRLLRNRADLGTIHLSMVEPGAQQQAPSLPPVQKPKLDRAFQKAVAGFLGVISSVVVGFGYLLPILVALVVVWLIVRRVRKARAVAV
jgi:Domain of unknown function (DUF4349)